MGDSSVKSDIYADNLEKFFLNHSVMVRNKLVEDAAKTAIENKLTNRDLVSLVKEFKESIDLVLKAYTGPDSGSMNLLLTTNFNSNLLFQVLILRYLTFHDSNPIDKLIAWRYIRDAKFEETFKETNTLQQEQDNLKKISEKERQYQLYNAEVRSYISLLHKYFPQNTKPINSETNESNLIDAFKFWAARPDPSKFKSSYDYQALLGFYGIRRSDDPKILEANAYLIKVQPAVKQDVFKIKEDLKKLQEKENVTPQKQTGFKHAQFATTAHDIGSVLTWPAFSSTSLNFYTVQNYYKKSKACCKFVIELPKAYPCHYIQGLGEYELLLAPCTQFKVVHKSSFATEFFPLVDDQTVFVRPFKWPVDVLNDSILDFASYLIDYALERKSDEETMEIVSRFPDKYARKRNLIICHYKRHTSILNLPLFTPFKPPILLNLNVNEKVKEKEKAKEKETNIDIIMKRTYVGEIKNPKHPLKKELFVAWSKTINLLNARLKLIPTQKIGFRIMSLNVHMGFRSADNSKFTGNETMKLLASLQPDALALQEFIKFPGFNYKSNQNQIQNQNQNKENQNESQNKEKQDIFGCNTNEGISNVTFVSSHHKIEEKHFLALNGDERCATIITIFPFYFQPNISLKNRNPFLLINLHLSVYSQQNRIKESNLLLQHLQDLESKMEKQQEKLQEKNQEQRKTPVIIVGDFNCVDKQDYSNDYWNFLSANQDHKQDYFTIELFKKAGFVDAFHLKNLRLSFSVWPGKRVDFILTKHVLKTQIKECFIVPTDFSDHLPVAIDFIP